MAARPCIVRGKSDAKHPKTTATLAYPLQIATCALTPRRMISRVCFRTTDGSIDKGTHRISLHVSGNGNCYSGWSSPVRMWAREMPMPTVLS